MALPNDDFDDLWQKKHLQTADVRNSWGATVSRALEVSKGENLSEVAAFGVSKLKECIVSLRTVADHLDRVERELTIQEEQVGPQGDSRVQLLAKLDEIAALLEADEKGETESE